MIIIEGADHTGKTTLAKNLARGLFERLQLPGAPDDHYRHMSRPEPGFDFWRDHAKLVTTEPLVQDRFHLGVLVYGCILGMYDVTPMRFDRRRMDMMRRFLSWSGALVVVLVCDERVLRRRLERSEKAEMYDLDTIVAANDAFSVLTQTGDADVAIDVTSEWPGRDTATSIINEWADRRKGSLAERASRAKQHRGTTHVDGSPSQVSDPGVSSVSRDGQDGVEVHARASRSHDSGVSR